MTLTSKQLDDALARLGEFTRRAPGLADELAASRAEFLGASAPLPGSDDERLARRRHMEWFLLERPSASMGGVPLEVALHGERGDELREALGEQALAALVSSRCGIFTVTGVRPGEGLWVRDLVAFGEYPLKEADGSHALEVEDLIVGRLFAVGGELHRLSPAAGTWRNAALLAALTADLERARAGLRGVPRLSQLELESMFWGEERARRRAVLQRARSVLLAGGLSAGDVRDVFDRLRAAPLDVAHPTPGGGDELGAILDQLAIETEIDIAEARVALLAAWPVLRLPAPSAPEVDVAKAMAEFDRGRDAGRDLEELFDELEAQLRLKAEDEPAESHLAPDFPGVVGAMVEEFLWEAETVQGPDVAAAHGCLRELSRFGASIGLFEELGSRQLLAFAAVWLPERGGLSSGGDAAQILSSLRAFCEWTERHHEHPLAAVFEESIAPLENSLPRVIEANRASTPAAPDQGELFEFVSAAGDRATLLDPRGREQEHLLPAGVCEHLRSGDRLRGLRAEGERLTLFCCYPAECAVLGKSL